MKKLPLATESLPQIIHNVMKKEKEKRGLKLLIDLVCAVCIVCRLEEGCQKLLYFNPYIFIVSSSCIIFSGF